MTVSRWHQIQWPILIFAWFLVVFSVNGLMVYFARSTHHGVMETRSPYTVGMEYQQSIDRQNAFAALGTRPQWTWGPIAEGKRSLQLSLPGARGLKGDEVLHLKALFAEGDRLDFEADLLPEAGKTGFFGAKIDARKLRPGQWFVSLTGQGEGPGAEKTQWLWKETLRIF